MKAFLLIVTVLAGFPAVAQERPEIIRIPPRPTPCVRCWLPLQTKALNVEVNLDGRTAVTEVTQDLYNPGPRLEEGEWIFPMPKGSAIEDFTLFINGVETRAELLDANKARKIYTDIVRKMRDPALLEYMGGGLFKARIFPIEARGTRTVRLKYREVLTSDAGLYRYSYPLRAARFVGGKIGTFSLTARLETETPLQTVYSPTHRFDITRPKPRRAVLSFEAQNHPPDRDVDVLFSTGREPIALDALTHARGDERFFWMTVTPDLSQAEIVPKDIVLAFDTSGSMAGEKMEKALAALRFCIANLNDDDRFQIIRFSTEAEAMTDTLLPATAANRQRARQFIDGFRPIGGTNIDEALTQALAFPVDTKRPQVVILITDGKPTIGERNEGPLVERLKKDGRHRLFTFGIGYQVNTHLLDKLAEAGGGRRTYATPDEDLELKLSAFFNRVQSPVMTDPKLTVNGVRISQVHPGKLPDLFRGTPLTIFGRYTGSGSATVVLEGAVQGKRERVSRRIQFPQRRAENTFIPELWAQRRVGHLLDEIRLHGEDRELIDEIKRLARRYGIVTPYTSYLILEDSPKVAGNGRPRPQAPGVFQEAEESFRSDLAQRSGEGAVSVSEDLRIMSEADVAAPREKKRQTGGKDTTSLTEWVAGRAFYLVDETWMDGSLPDNPTYRKITFGSDAYFNLLTQFPDLAPILALGPQVNFLHNGTAYAITD
ncbi:MAG: VIT domain-containing protein [Acidobacteriota bacterium]|nr:VIT domain-containing protein [Acidobacteriota bacterium]